MDLEAKSHSPGPPEDNDTHLQFELPLSPHTPDDGLNGELPIQSPDIAQTDSKTTNITAAAYFSKNARTRLGKDIELPVMDGAESASSRRHQMSSRDNGAWIEQKRKNLATYEYLCHIGEAKRWIEKVIGEELPDETELGAEMRYGVILAKLVRAFEPKMVKKIFEDRRLQFRHTDNFVIFFEFCKKIGVPEIFLFETTDLYDLKNLPKVIFSMHAVSHLLHRLGRAPRIENLVGKLDFTEDDVQAVHDELVEQGIALPSFGTVENSLSREIAQIFPEEKVVVSQRAIRYFLNRRYHQSLNSHYGKEHQGELVTAQRVFRRFLQEKKEQQAHAYYQARTRDIVQVQDAMRIYLKSKHNQMLMGYYQGENLQKLIAAQRIFRLMAEKAVFASQMQYYTKRGSDVVQSQAYIRTFLQKILFDKLRMDQLSLETDESLTMPALGRIIHMFGSHEADAESLDLEIENHHAMVMKLLRDIAVLEEDLAGKDTKIELLVRNRVSIGDLVKETKKRTRSKAELSGPLEVDQYKSTAIFRSRPTLRSARHSLECYQSLFYLLQTQPKYLIRLINAIGGANEKYIKRTLNACILVLFSYAQNAREEFLLLKAFECAIEHDIGTAEEVTSVPKSAGIERQQQQFFSPAVYHLFNNGLPVLNTMLRCFSRFPNERAYLKAMLEPCINEVLSCKRTLETDPVAMHKLLIKEEESSTGVKTSKKFDITRQEALEDGDVLKALRSNSDELFKHVLNVFRAVTMSIGEMPYGIRYITRFLRQTMIKKFGSTEEVGQQALRLVAQTFFTRFINPAIVSPDSNDVTTESISPIARKNLSEVTKILNAICLNTPLPASLDHQEIPEWFEKARSDFVLFLHEVYNVNEPETQLQYDYFADAATRRQPVIYISPSDILFVHEVLAKYRSEIFLDEKKLVEPSINEAETIVNETSQVAENGAEEEEVSSKMQLKITLEKREVEHSTPDPMGRILDLLGSVGEFDHETSEPEVRFQLSSSLASQLDWRTQEEYNVRRLFAYVKQEVTRLIRVHGNCESIGEMIKLRVTLEDEELFSKCNTLYPATPVMTSPQMLKNGGHGMGAGVASSTGALSAVGLGASATVLNTSHGSHAKSAAMGEDASHEGKTQGSGVVEFNDSLSLSGNKEQSKCAILLQRLHKSGPPLTMKECKASVTEILEVLEESGLVSSEDEYFAVLRSIARDFRKRHKRAEQQRARLASLKNTCTTLKVKQDFLKQQEMSYDHYINACMQRLSLHSDSGGRKKRTLLPFSKQARHLKEIERKTGQVPLFGSYKYSVRELMDRNVIMNIDMDGMTPKIMDKLSIAISSSKQGVFDITVSTSVASISFAREEDVLHLDDLLQYDYENVRELKLFDDVVTANVQLLLHLINKKFYA